ncbi:MAG: hypothetical protein DDT35_01375 [Firmicutes bacterium]|nr:hypothetical protein [Bacillota bacterium]
MPQTRPPCLAVGKEHYIPWQQIAATHFLTEHKLLTNRPGNRDIETPKDEGQEPRRVETTSGFSPKLERPSGLYPSQICDLHPHRGLSEGVYGHHDSKERQQD